VSIVHVRKPLPASNNVLHDLLIYLAKTSARDFARFNFKCFFVVYRRMI